MDKFNIRNDIQSLRGLSVILIFLFHFDQVFVNNDEKLRDKIVTTFIKSPKLYQFDPSYKLIYFPKENITVENIIKLTKFIAEQIITC